MSSILDKIEIVRLEEGAPISSFDCGDLDLNDFLHNDSKNYLKSMLAVTYLLKIEEEIAAYFCLSYDGLTRTTILTGEEIMYMYEPHHAGCRFVTVDAYHSALQFYERNDFRYLTTKDKDEDTRVMYFDLKAV